MVPERAAARHFRFSMIIRLANPGRPALDRPAKRAASANSAGANGQRGNAMIFYRRPSESGRISPRLSILYRYRLYRRDSEHYSRAVLSVLRDLQRLTTLLVAVDPSRRHPPNEAAKNLWVEKKNPGLE